MAELKNLNKLEEPIRLPWFKPEEFPSCMTNAQFLICFFRKRFGDAFLQRKHLATAPPEQQVVALLKFYKISFPDNEGTIVNTEHIVPKRMIPGHELALLKLAKVLKGFKGSPSPAADVKSG